MRRTYSQKVCEAIKWSTIETQNCLLDSDWVFSALLLHTNNGCHRTFGFYKSELELVHITERFPIPPVFIFVPYLTYNAIFLTLKKNSTSCNLMSTSNKFNLFLSKSHPALPIITSFVLKLRCVLKASQVIWMSYSLHFNYNYSLPNPIANLVHLEKSWELWAHFTCTFFQTML